MSAPTKRGLDYFPLDTDTDDKIDLIERKYGLIGFGFIIKLYSKIYKLGYYYRFGDYEKTLLAIKLGIDIQLINDIISDCFLFDLLNKDVFDKYKILTSRGIQKRYFEAIARRKEIFIIEEILLINLNDYKNLVNSTITKENVNINGVNVYINSQSKVKYNKEKEIKEEELFVDSKKEIKGIKKGNEYIFKEYDKSDESKEAMFSRLWIYYDKKAGMQKAWNAFKDLNKQELELMKQHLKKYIPATPDKQFRKLLATYINQKTWNDEIINPKVKNEEPNPYR